MQQFNRCLLPGTVLGKPAKASIYPGGPYTVEAEREPKQGNKIYQNVMGTMKKTKQSKRVRGPERGATVLGMVVREDLVEEITLEWKQQMMRPSQHR